MSLKNKSSGNSPSLVLIDLLQYLNKIRHINGIVIKNFTLIRTEYKIQKDKVDKADITIIKFSNFV